MLLGKPVMDLLGVAYGSRTATSVDAAYDATGDSPGTESAQIGSIGVPLPLLMPLRAFVTCVIGVASNQPGLAVTRAAIEIGAYSTSIDYG